MGLPPGEIAPDATGLAPDAQGPVPDAQGPVPDADGLAPDAEGLAGAEGTGGPAGARGQVVAHGPVVPRARPATGDARVDDAVARLDDLGRLPLAEHLAVFEYVHERLTEALGDLDVHAPAHSGGQPGPGAPGG
jgi:hypothetical protein